MSKFQDFPLAWHDREFVIPANRIMGAIARVEDFVTLGELQDSARKGTAPLGKLARAYAALLTYAGAPVSDEDVYLGMFGEGQESVKRTQTAVLGLMSLMLPPDHLKVKEGEATPGKTDGGAAASVSPKKPGKPRSRPAGARTKRSGR